MHQLIDQRVDQRVQRKDFPGIHLDVSRENLSFEFFDLCVRACVCVYVCTVCMYVRMYVCRYVRTYVRTYVSGLKPGQIIWVNRVTFFLGHPGLTRFIKYPGLTRIGSRAILMASGGESRRTPRKFIYIKFKYCFSVITRWELGYN